MSTNATRETSTATQMRRVRTRSVATRVFASPDTLETAHTARSLVCKSNYVPAPLHGMDFYDGLFYW